MQLDKLIATNGVPHVDNATYCPKVVELRLESDCQHLATIIVSKRERATAGRTTVTPNSKNETISHKDQDIEKEQEDGNDQRVRCWQPHLLSRSEAVHAYCAA